MADSLAEALGAQEASIQAEPARFFKPGERVRLTEAPFVGIKGIYQMVDGERRAMVLIELLSKEARGAGCTSPTARGRLKPGQNISQGHDGVANYSDSLALLQHSASFKSFGFTLLDLADRAC